MTELINRHLHGAGFSEATATDVKSDLDPQLSRLKKTQRDAVIKSRIGQGPFRDRVSRLWDKKCAVTGYDLLPVLRASHIKPWRDATNAERLDPHNGLFLIPNLDAAFDQGLISFTSKGKLLLSRTLSSADAATLGTRVGAMLRKLPRSMIKYLKYHRRHVFQG